MSHVETFIQDYTLAPGWQCLECGEEESGFLSLYHAEEAGDRHACDQGEWRREPGPPPRREVVVELPPLGDE